MKKSLFKSKKNKRVFGRKKLINRRKNFYNRQKNYSSSRLRSNIAQQKRIIKRNRDLSGVIIKYTIMFAIGILAILLVYFLFFSNYFKIKNINLVDATEVNEEQIHNSFEKFKEKRRFLIFPAENIFLMDEERLRRIILDDNLYVEDVNIEKKLIDVIKVRVKEKVISAVWVSGSNLYYIDNIN
jgi:cell division septal protein FtsQ